MRAPPEREQNPQRQRSGHCGEGNDHIEHQPAPQAGIHEGQAQHAAAQQHAGNHRKHHEKAGHEYPAVTHMTAQHWPREQGQQRQRQMHAPELRCRVVAIKERRQAHANEGPACALTDTGRFRRAGERRPCDAPANQGRQNQRREGHHHERQQRVDARIEQVGAHPTRCTRQGGRRVGRDVPSGCGGATHRVTNATCRLYQFMNAEAERLMDRNTAIRIRMVSISRPDCCRTVPAKIWNSSG